jgi:membrane protease YdiL (CAAX protease family)
MFSRISKIETNKIIILILVIQSCFALIIKHYSSFFGLPIYRSIIIMLASVAIFLMFYLDKLSRPKKSNLKPLVSFFFIFGAQMVIMLSQKTWFSLLTSISTEEYTPSYLGEVPYKTAISAISILMSIVIAPIKEELIYRHGYLRLFTTYMRPTLAILLSSTIFAATHIGTLPIQSLPAIFVGGIVLSITYITVGLWWTILLHLLQNALPLLNANDSAFVDTIGTLFTVFCCIGSFVFLYNIITFNKRKRINP